MDNHVSSFFGVGNNWDLTKIIEGNYPKPLQNYLSDMLSFASKDKYPFILPRLDSNQQLWFYIVSDSLLQLNELLSMVKAYLGSSYIYTDPIEYKSTSDPLEQEILEISPHGFCRFAIPLALNPNKLKVYWVMDSFNKLIQQYHERPPLLSTIKRPIGTILRSFFIACKHQRGGSAYEYFLEVKAHQSISNRNLLSLELQALFAASKWNDILHHPRLPDLLSSKIPRKLQAQLLFAVNAKFIKDFDFDELDVEIVRQHLLPYQSLFFSAPDIPQSEDYVLEWKAWVTGASAFGYVKVNSISPDLLGLEWLKRLYDWAGLPQAEVQKNKVPEYDDVSSLLSKEPSIETGSLLLKELIFSSPEIVKKIYIKISAYPENIFEKLMSSAPIAGMWQSLESEYREQTEISSWLSLFEHLTKEYDESSLSNLLRIVDEESEFWEKEEDYQKLDTAIQKLSEGAAATILRDLLPLFVSWIEKHKLKLSVTSIEHLMLILVMDEKSAIEDLLLCNDLMELIFAQPHSKAQYLSIVDTVSQCWLNVESVNGIESCLEVFENLIDSPCPDENIRLSFWIQVQSFAIKHWQRLNQVNRLLCQEVALVLQGSLDLFPASRENNPEEVTKDKPDLLGKKLAIYSLTESAARRASTILQTMYPGLEVKTNSDKSATEALTSLIKSSDYFIFAARSAAHQAFYPLTSARKDIIYPEGKGSSSMVRAFENTILV